MNESDDSHIKVKIEALRDSQVEVDALQGDSPFTTLEFCQFSTEVAADEVFWMQSDSKIVYVNKSACEKLGYSREELLGMYVWEWDPLFPKAVWPEFWQEFKTKKHIVFETQHQTKSGHIFPVEVQAHYSLRENDEYLFAYVTDISDRKEKQAEIEAYQNNLEQLVKERTKELEYAKAKAEQSAIALEKAKDAAVYAAQVKSQFLANMSHEVRTPMNGVKGLTDALLTTELDEQQLKWVKAIKHSADSLMTIVNDILDLSKIESGKLNIESAPFSITELLANLESSISHQLKEKHLSFACPATPVKPRHYIGDPYRIQQILLNFISNAIKFTAQGSISVNVQHLAKKADKHQLRFEVIDTGIGIDERDKQKLFERFSQVDESTTRKFGGTGLGLSISKQLVDLMGGDIGFSSIPGDGSCFWFTLWLQQTAAQRTEKSMPVAGAIDLDAVRFSNIRALVVEDNEINQEVILFNLEDAGLDVDVVANGEEAVYKVKQQRYDVVFMDCHMPVLDGYHATQQIRQTKGLETLPIIALTASAMSGEREKCLASGMNDFIAKPFEYADIVAALCKHLPHHMDNK